jgi:hypothetical protein
MSDAVNIMENEEDKLTELYLKLERLQSYLKKIDGKMKKYTMELEVRRKAREKKESELLGVLKNKRLFVSDQTI